MIEYCKKCGRVRVLFMQCEKALAYEKKKRKELIEKIRCTLEESEK